MKNLFKQMVEDIVNVQPMTGNVGQIFNIKHTMPAKYEIDRRFTAPDGYLVIGCYWEVGSWIQTQPIHMWKEVDTNPPEHRLIYMISEQLYTLLALRWAK